MDCPDNTYPCDTELVRELLKGKRRARDIKACFSCRSRKVRCDGNTPCSSCVRRNHAELCFSASHAGRGQRDHRESSLSRLQGVQTVQQSVEYSFQSTIESPQPLLGDPSGGGLASAGSKIIPSSIDLDAMIRRLDAMGDQIASMKAELIRARDQGNGDGNGNANQPQNQGVLVNDNSPAPSDSDRSNQHQQQRRHALLAKSPGQYVIEEVTGATIFLGGNSDPPPTLGCRQASDMQMAGDNLLERLVPRIYPFSSLWRPEVSFTEVCLALPEDSDIVRYWDVYQKFVHPFYPALVTMDQFSESLFPFLEKRPTFQDDAVLKREIDPSWLALLFSVLACGVQFSSDPAKERDLRSKVFICSSFQCLRATNFFSNTNMNQIQAMSLISHCLRNNLDTNCSWILMGATVRLAQSIGLHEESVPGSSLHTSSVEQYQRKRLWWMLVWQDSFLSFTYDRPLSAANVDCRIPYTTNSSSSDSNKKEGNESGYSFAESIFTLCEILLDRARDLSLHSHRHTQTHTDADADENAYTQTEIHFKSRMESILDSAAPFLRDKARCRTIQDHLERLALKVHIGYASCRLGRLLCFGSPATTTTTTYNSNDSATYTNSGDNGGDGMLSRETQNLLLHSTAQRATEVVESFLDIHRLSANVCRSWSLVHNAVSCAIILQRLGRDDFAMDFHHAQVHAATTPFGSLVRRLLAVLEKEGEQSRWHDTDGNVRNFGPYSRAIEALKWDMGVLGG